MSYYYIKHGIKYMLIWSKSHIIIIKSYIYLPMIKANGYMLDVPKAFKNENTINIA